METSEISTRKYGKLFNDLIGEFKAPVGDFDGTIKVKRLRKYNDDNRYYGGEVDIIFDGYIMARNGNMYQPKQFGKKSIRNFIRSHFEKPISLRTRLIGVDNVKICKIEFP
jgi:hypothetical protein